MRVASALLLALLLQTSARVAPDPKHFHFERGIEVPPGATGPVCAALDGAVYEHSTALTDIRLYAGGAEQPYATLTSQAVTATSDVVRPINLGEQGGHIVFDLPMPSRPYSTVNLKLGGQNFLAAAKVTGRQSATAQTCCGTAAGTELGTFTLFDLTAQRLGRSTSLALAESTFPWLHVDLAVTAAPGHPGFVAKSEMVDGAEIPPSREAQTLYTTVAETTQILQMEQQSVAVFQVPAHVPVERVSFELEQDDKTNFSRTVHVTARAVGDARNGSQQAAIDEDVYGEISRVRMTEGGKEIRQENLDVPAILGSNGQTEARVQVAVENGDDKPVAIRSVRLEMRQRKLCFDAPAQPVTMFYGDARLAAPAYDYSRLFQPSDTTLSARLDAETANPAYVAPLEHKTLLERYPAILWAALLAVVAVLGVVAFRSAKRV